jgi:hypothetical protein
MTIKEVNHALAVIAAKTRPRLVMLQRNAKKPGAKTTLATLAERLRAVKLIRGLNAKLDKIPKRLDFP